MVNLLGATLPERKLVKIALLSYYGVGYYVSGLIMQRLGFPDQMRVSELTDAQINSLSALLSSPSTFSEPMPPTATTSKHDPRQKNNPLPPLDERGMETLSSLKIGEDLRREVRGNIAHHRTIGTLRGRQHAMGLPVRGQRNSTNARTAKRLNRIERRGYATFATPQLRPVALSAQPPRFALPERTERPASKILDELAKLRIA